MLLDERREQILKVIENKGFVSLHDLVQRVGVSESTIRRDLEVLDGIGQIRRTRGGAAYVGESLTGFEERHTRALPQKQRIAKVVAGEIHSGDTVLLDGGTTTLEVARQLTGKSLQVVTNSLPIANLLVNQPQIELIMIGGYLYPKTGVALGPLAVAALQDLHVPKLILSVGGITEKGLFNSNTLLVEAERTMLGAAEQVVVAADSGKFGRSALAHLCSLDAIQQMVTDAEITPAWEKVVRDAGIDLTIAPDES